MSFEVPSISEVKRVVENGFSNAFYGKSGMLRFGVLKMFASVIAGAVYLLCLMASKIWKDRFVSTCSVEALDGFGVEYGMPHKPPQNAIGYVSAKFTAYTSASVTIPDGTFLVDDAGHEYQTTYSQKLKYSENHNIEVIAYGAGAEYNQSVGAILKFRDDVPTGLEEELTVVNDSAGRGIDGGYSVEVNVGKSVQNWGETADAYRSRLLERVQNPVLGGTAKDLKRWAESFSFVSNAYVRENAPNVNSASVAIANYNSDNVVVPFEQVEEVYAYLSSDDRRVICSDIRVFSVTKAAFEVVASFTPYNAANKDIVDNALNSVVGVLEPGQSISFSAAAAEVKAISGVSGFEFVSVKKNGSAVSLFQLDFSASDSVAQVPVINASYKKA